VGHIIATTNAVVKESASRMKIGHDISVDRAEPSCHPVEKWPRSIRTGAEFKS
jgi:hypothetical protein